MAVLPYLALAASAAGTGAQVASSVQEQRKAEDAAQAELARQKGFQKQASGEFSKSLAQSGIDTQRRQQAAGTQTLMEGYQRQAGLPSGLTSAAESIPTSQVSDARTQGQVQEGRQTQARLGGISTWDVNQQIKNLRAQQQLGIISSFAHGSQQVLPWELHAAGQSAEGLRAAGVGLGMAGSLGSLYNQSQMPSSSPGVSYQDAYDMSSPMGGEPQSMPVAQKRMRAPTFYQS